jgi:chromate transport protein ChrA
LEENKKTEKNNLHHYLMGDLVGVSITVLVIVLVGALTVVSVVSVVSTISALIVLKILVGSAVSVVLGILEMGTVKPSQSAQRRR